MLFSRFWLIEKKSANQNREHNISFEDFLCYLKDPRVLRKLYALRLKVYNLFNKYEGNLLKAQESGWVY